MGNMIATYIGIYSGAADTVCPKEFAPSSYTREAAEAKEGRYYLAANNTKIPIYGRKTVTGITDDWNGFSFEAEVADVKRPLASVCKICEAGNRVVFEQGSSYIENLKTGKRTNIEETGTGYRIKVWLPHFQGQGNP